MAFSTKKFSDFTLRGDHAVILSSYFVGYEDTGLKSEIRVPILSLLNNAFNQTQTIVYTNSSIWSDVSTSYIANSGNFQSTFATVNTLSATWGGLNNTKWDSTYTTMYENSAVWYNSNTILGAYSGAWDSVLTTVNSQSALWEYTAVQLNNLTPIWNNNVTTVQSYSGGWEEARSTVAANSALWAANGTDVISLTSNWENTYSSVQANSSSWIDAYSTVQGNSGNWDNNIVIGYTHTNFLPITGGTITGDLTASNIYSSSLKVGAGSVRLYVDTNAVGINTDTPAEALTVVGNISTSHVIYASGGNSDEWSSVYTSFKAASSTFISSPPLLSFDETNYDLTLTPGNTVSLSSINSADLNSIKALSGSWNNTYTTVANYSADWGYQGTDVKDLTGNWQDTFTITQAYSAEWYNAVTTTRDNSANWGIVTEVLASLSGNWENTYSTVLANSALWDTTADTSVRSLTSVWQDTYTTVRENSGYWNSTFSTVGTLSSNWSDVFTHVQNNSADWGYQGTDVKDLTGNWQNTYTTTQTNSSNWQDTYTLFSQQSSDNLAVQSVVAANSSTWKDTYTTVLGYSGGWGMSVDTSRYEATYTTVYQLSAGWESVYQQVTDDSQGWYDTTSTVIVNSANWDSAYQNLDNYLPLAGGTVTGNTLFQQNVTIYGDLSCTGTQTFANTIFTTTSALSVVHIGAGPAMWVGNNGTGDIASFYDIDQDREILHVGGHNSLYPYVGVNTSQPNKEFTVSGEISASGNITAEELLLNGARLQTLTTQATAYGEFLIMNINGVDRALRLWDF